MSNKGDFGYGATGREYRDDPGFGYQGNPRSSPYQSSGYGNFSEVVDQISSNMFKINNNANTIERSTKQIGTDKDSVHLRDKIHTTEQGTNILINETTRLFKQLSSICSRADRAQKLQFERLTGEFKVTVKRYNILQRNAAEKVRSAVVLSSQQGQSANLISLDEGQSDQHSLLQQEQRQAQLLEQQEVIETDVALLQEREHQILQLEADILDINDIFRELGTLVHEQGEVINSIEDNVEKTHGNVEAGNEQLSLAAEYQRKARKKKCCIVVILLVIVAIIVLVIVLSVKH